MLVATIAWESVCSLKHKNRWSLCIYPEATVWLFIVVSELSLSDG